MITIIVLATIAGIFHVLFFLLESVFYERPKVHGLFKIKPSDVPVTKIIFLNQGYYNLFLAMGAFLGIYLFSTHQDPVLLEYTMAFMVGAAIVLFLSDRKLYRASLIQGTIPFLTFLLLIL